MSEIIANRNCHVEARFHTLPPDLEPYFTTFCFGTVDIANGGTVSDAMQPEWATLRFFPDTAPSIQIDKNDQLSGAQFVASGPSSRKTDYTMGSSRFWGVGLLPLGWTTFVGGPANEMANRLVDGRKSAIFAHFAPLADVLLDPAKSEEEQLAFLTDYFRNDAPRFGKEDPRIARIHDCLLQPGLHNVEAMAEYCAIGGRTLERLCRKAFGFPPKLLLRRQRFMRSLSQYMLDPEASWTSSIDPLYYDQSHFVRDSHRFFGHDAGRICRAGSPDFERLYARPCAASRLPCPSARPANHPAEQHLTLPQFTG